MDKLTVDGRIASFKKGNWPHSAKTPKFAATPETLSQAGFYCRPMSDSPDNCSCFLCQKNLDGWEAPDEAWNEHVKHAPSCPLVRLDMETNRLATFTKMWPFDKPNSSLAPLRMAKAGFFYWPKVMPAKDYVDDTCVCFQCGLALDGWEPEDDPRVEHAKRRPDCPFIRNGIALKPCSFEFILASKPDRNAITHISASQKASVPKNTFQMPSSNRDIALPAPPPRKIAKVSAVPATPVRSTAVITETPVRIAASITEVPSTRKRGRPRKSSIVPPPATPSTQPVQLPQLIDPDLLAYVTQECLDLPLKQLLPLLADRAISQFDRRTRALIENLNKA